jgi:putative toxin-antitoxin system antitoxin component (TIGR02293 family)
MRKSTSGKVSSALRLKNVSPGTTVQHVELRGGKRGQVAFRSNSASVHFAEVYARSVEVLGSDDKAMRWLGRPIPALDYALPVTLLRDKKGQDAVLDVLCRLEHSVF